MSSSFEERNFCVIFSVIVDYTYEASDAIVLCDVNMFGEFYFFLCIKNKITRNCGHKTSEERILVIPSVLLPFNAQANLSNFFFTATVTIIFELCTITSVLCRMCGGKTKCGVVVVQLDRNKIQANKVVKSSYYNDVKRDKTKFLC